MTTFIPNPFTRQFLLASGAVILAAGRVFAASPADAQEEARNLLSGVTATGVFFPVNANESSQIDPQVRAQWLLAGKPPTSAVDGSNEPQRTVPVFVSERDAASVAGDRSVLARRLLAGKGY